MSQTLTYVMGGDRRAHVDNIQDFKVDFSDDNHNWVQARQFERGMRQVFVNVTNEDGTPFDLTGCNVWFEGLLPKTADGDFRVIDDKGYVALDPSAGRFRFDMPGHAFTVAGSYRQAFFRIVKNGNSVTTLEFDLDVLADKVIDGLVPKDWIGPFEEIADKLVDDLQKHTDSADKIIADFQKKVTDLVNQLNQQGSMTTSMLTDLRSQMAALQDKINNEHLFTEDEADAFKQEVLKELNQLELHVYDTVADMKAADLAKGQTARTLGEYKLNDGGGATYKITDNPTSYSVDLQSGLKAEQINVTDNNFYDEITWYRERDHKHHTDIYYVTIPKNDKNGNLIMPEMNYEGYEYSPTEWARHKHTTLTVNGDAAINVGNNTWMNGNIISGGKIINQSDQGKHFPSRMKSVAIMKDRSVRVYSAEGTTAQQMVDDGAQVAFTVYYQLVQDGKKLDFSKMDDDLSIKSAAGGLTTDHYPCVGLGIKPDGTWIVIGCDGRTLYDNGLTADEFAEKFIDQGCTEAYRFDGGGSSSINWRGIKINKSFDDDMNADRKVRFTLDFIKPTAADNANSIAASQAGVAAQVANYHANAAANAFYQTMQKGAGQIVVKSDQELDDFLKRLPDMLNETQFPNGGIIRGILSTSYHNSAPGKVVGLAQAFDWHFKYYMTGSHNYTMLDMVSVNDANIHIWRSFARTSKPQWGPWQSMFGVTAIPAKLTPEITKLVAFRIGNVVEVDAFVHTSSQAWHTIASGLPVPISSIAIRTLGVNNGGQGRFTIDGNGNLMGRTIDGKLDDFEVHYTYLHGLTNKEA